MILVTGLDYSGTSMTAGLLHHLGVDMGTWHRDVTPASDIEQWTCIQAGGHLRTWLTYEDEPLRQRLAHYYAHAASSVSYGDYIRELSWALYDYPHAGLKHNLYCLFPSRPVQAHVLIMTHRDEAERHARERYYLGTLLDDPALARLARWVQVGYDLLRHDADLMIEFAELRAWPHKVIDHLVEVVGLTPTPTQYMNAYGSITRGE